MSKYIRKLAAVILAAAIGVSAAGVGVHALTNPAAKRPAEAKTEHPAAAASEPRELTKDETVYVFASADGSVQKIVVSDWIKNELGSSAISDRSELSGIENTNGDEAYTLDQDHMVVWDANGSDIYYQGNLEKELPVDLSVSYWLDGKSVSAGEIAGKSGKVTVRFDYDNRQYETVPINGNDEKIYVPFAMLTGMVLDNGTFRNVEVTNGKVMNDGDRTVVVGIAFPGMQDNLALDTDTLEIPDYVEITADATDFQMGMTVTIAANELFQGFDAEKLEDTSDLTEAAEELTAAMEQLMDGSSALYDGLCTLLDKSDELVAGINQLADGARELNNGAASLEDGAAALSSGASQLSSGLNTLSSNSASLNSGAAQVFNSLLSTANTQISAAGLEVPALTIGSYAEVLNQAIASLDDTAVYNQALAQVTSAVEANRPYIEQQVTQAIRKQVQAQVAATVQQQVQEQVTAAVRAEVYGQVLISAGLPMTPEEYEQAIAAGTIPAETQEQIAAAVEAQMAGETVQNTVASELEAQLASEQVQALIAENTDSQMQSNAIQQTISENTELQVQKAISENMASAEVQSQLAAASQGAQSLIALKASLDSYNGFYLGLQSYTAGVDSAASGAASLTAGAAELKEGASQLKTGCGSLYDGILQLQNNVPALVDGVTQLRDGAMELSDGLKQFNEEGIQRITEFLGDASEDTIARLRATIDVSENYQTFSGMSDGMDGQVRFIYRTEEIN